jgi:hypothetical protein
MTKFQLFTRKPGQLAVGNKYAIYSTLAEAQTELRRWLKIEMSKNGNICYLFDYAVEADKIEGIEYNGYKGAGWYRCNSGYYDIIFYSFSINADDFTEFWYDLTKYFIEEIEVENE